MAEGYSGYGRRGGGGGVYCFNQHSRQIFMRLKMFRFGDSEFDFESGKNR